MTSRHWMLTLGFLLLIRVHAARVQGQGQLGARPHTRSDVIAYSHWHVLIAAGMQEQAHVCLFCRSPFFLHSSLSLPKIWTG